jgi:hypothetical protein
MVIANDVSVCLIFPFLMLCSSLYFYSLQSLIIQLCCASAILAWWWWKRGDFYYSLSYGVVLENREKRTALLSLIVNSMRIIPTRKSWGTACLYNALGTSLLFEGKFSESCKWISKAVQVAGSKGFEWQVESAIFLDNVARVNIELGRLDEAEDASKAALHQWNTIKGDTRYGAAYSRTLLGEIALLSGNISEAHSQLCAAMTMFDQCTVIPRKLMVGFWNQTLTKCYQLMVIVKLKRDEPDFAQQYFDKLKHHLKTDPEAVDALIFGTTILLADELTKRQKKDDATFILDFVIQFGKKCPENHPNLKRLTQAHLESG